jgi:hypothetical protein
VDRKIVYSSTPLKLRIPVRLLVSASPLRMRAFFGWLAPLVLIACTEDEGRNHRYLNKPPAPVVRPAMPASTPVPEPAIGSMPSARIMSVRNARTGTPTSLEEVREPLEILAMVSRGRGTPASRPARLELALTGPTDTVLALQVSPAVPLVIALPFHISVGAPGGLAPGRYEARARIVGEGAGTMAESAPLRLVVQP